MSIIIICLLIVFICCGFAYCLFAGSNPNGDGKSNKHDDIECYGRWTDRK